MVEEKGGASEAEGEGFIKIISIGRVGQVIPITDLALVVEGEGVLVAFDTTIEIMAHSSSGGSWPKGRKGRSHEKNGPHSHK